MTNPETRKKESLLFVSSGIPSFTRHDIDILSSEYDVILFTKKWNGKLIVTLNHLSLFFKIIALRKKISRIVISFAGHWSYIPSILGKWFKIPVVIVLHGTDCSSLPSLNYGLLHKPILKRIVNASIKNARLLLPVSESLIEIKNTYNGDNNESRQGIKSFFPSNDLNYEVIYNGIDADFWKSQSNNAKEKNSFLAVFSNRQFILKGGDLIFKLAIEFPNSSFYIAGCDKSPEGIEKPQNVHLLGHLSKDNLLEHYNKSQFYFQLSIFEGFGCSLVEAMMCNCIPIGSNVNIIPFIIGDTGLIVKDRNATDLIATVKYLSALTSKELRDRFTSSRIRAVEKFELQLRKQKLIAALKNID